MLKIFTTIKKKALTFFLILCLPTLSFSKESTEIKLWKWDMNNPPVRELLKLVLDHTVEEYGAYQLKPSIEMTHARVSRAVERGLIDVFSNASNQQLEQQLLPIRIPINQGLLGIRVCLIRAHEQSRFDEIHSLVDWQNSGLTMGQGSDWMDTKILMANHLKVITNSKYLPLFDMLMKKRFDCFPRSIAEVQAELERYGDKGITLEKNLIFMYRLPLFYWVSKSQPQLAQRIEMGLKTMQKNGEFEKHFQQQFKSFIEAIRLDERKVIRLQNPFLSPATQALTKQPALWFKLFNQTDTKNTTE